MPSNKIRSLAALYQEMPTTEIERRLRHTDLSEVPRSVASEELLRRQAQPTVAPLPIVEEDLDSAPSKRPQVAMFLLGMAAFSAAVWFLLSKELAILLTLTISLPAVATLIGKAVPGPAQIVGWLLIATPLWLGAFMWHSGDLDWKGGDLRPLGTIVMWGVLIVLSLLGIGIGSSLVAGARHEGHWEDLIDELDQAKKDGVDAARRLE